MCYLVACCCWPQGCHSCSTPKHHQAAPQVNAGPSGAPMEHQSRLQHSTAQHKDAKGVAPHQVRACCRWAVRTWGKHTALGEAIRGCLLPVAVSAETATGQCIPCVRPLKNQSNKLLRCMQRCSAQCMTDRPTLHYVDDRRGLSPHSIKPTGKPTLNPAPSQPTCCRASIQYNAVVETDGPVAAAGAWGCSSHGWHCPCAAIHIKHHQPVWAVQQEGLLGPSYISSG